MGIEFNQNPIEGKNGNPQLGSFEAQDQRRFYFGLNGQTEVRGGRSGRVISVLMWVFNNFDDYTACQDYLEENIYQKVDSHGTLKLTDAVHANYEFEECTLERFELLQGPIPDVAQTVDNGKWFAIGTLHFHQLKTD